MGIESGFDEQAAGSEQAGSERENPLAQQYLAEYGEALAAVRTDLLAMARGDAESREQKLVNRVFRAVHSVRGSAFFGLNKIAELAHLTEEALARIESRGARARPFEVRLLLIANDRLIELVRNSETSNEADIAQAVAALARLQPDIHCRCKTETPEDGGRHLRALVGEDDFACRLLIKTFLSRYGECDAAADGKGAVELFRTAAEQGKRYNLVCMDVRMPEMDGPEAVRQLRELEEQAGISFACRARVVMMTSVDDIRDMIRSFQEFSDAYLMKPINLSSLLRQLKSWELIPGRQ